MPPTNKNAPVKAPEIAQQQAVTAGTSRTDQSQEGAAKPSPIDTFPCSSLEFSLYIDYP